MEQAIPSVKKTRRKAVKTEAPLLEQAAPPIAPRFDFKFYMTCAIGTGIPLLSLALSKIAGTLATSGFFILAFFAFSLMCAVLIVSLPHLAWSIGDITRSENRASWALAIALDLSLVLCEFVHTFANETGLDWVIVAVMITVCLFSMLLNCWAFFKAPHPAK